MTLAVRNIPANCWHQTRNNQLSSVLPSDGVATMNYTDGIRAGRCLLPVIVYAQGREETGICLSALVDTGAMHSAIYVGVADMLGLPRAHLGLKVSTPHGFQDAHSYLAVLEVPKVTELGIVSRRFANLQPMLSMDSAVGYAPLLIGMDLINKSVRFEVCNGIWTLEFAP